MKLIDLLVKELPKLGGWPEGANESIEMHMDGDIFFDGDLAPEDFNLPLCSDGWEPGLGMYSNEVTRDQYEAALAKNDGWIEWGGGECPVDLHSMLDVKYLGGGINTNVKAGGQVWYHTRHFGDIIAYRPHRDINSRANDDRLERDLNECIGQDVALAWDGEGLPPVGAECEIYNCSEWFAVKIKFIGDKWIVAEPLEGMNEDCCENQLHGEDCYSIADKPHAFRPLRTEAEKKRDEAIEFIREIIDAKAGDPFNSARFIYECMMGGNIPGVKLESK